VILNPSVIIGPGDLNLISGSLILEIARGKVPFLPLQGGITLIDVRDVARAHLAAAERGGTGERYLLGAVNITHRGLMRLTAEIVGVVPPRIPAPGFVVTAAALLVDAGRALHIPIPGDPEGNQLRLSKRNIYFDCSKSWRELDEPRIDLTQSIADTYHWYRDNGYL
jgi:dihydroflavonol-4-reductase